MESREIEEAFFDGSRRDGEEGFGFFINRGWGWGYLVCGVAIVAMVGL